MPGLALRSWSVAAALGSGGTRRGVAVVVGLGALLGGGGCAVLGSAIREGTPAAVGGQLAVFGFLSLVSLVIAILAASWAERVPLLGLAAATWGLLLVHVVGLVAVVEAAALGSGLLPWYLRAAALTSLVPVGAAVYTTTLALGQSSRRPRRWLPPAVTAFVVLVHGALLARFVFERDPLMAISSAPVVEVRVGAEHGCARHEDGAVTCWGNNDDGQLGDGTRQTVAWPVAVSGLFDAVALAVGDGRSCARTRDGEVLCWGREPRSGERAAAPVPIASAALDGPWIAGDRVFVVNINGQVSSGESSLTPIVPAPPLTEVAPGLRHVCARLGDGRVTCWGGGERGQLGAAVEFERGVPTEADDPARLDLQTRTLVPGVRDAVKLVSGDHHVCALRATGTVMCWGVIDEGAERCRDGCASAGPAQVEGLTEIVDLSAGAAHTCALRRNGAVVCWGDNRWGQLGIGGYERQPAPQRATLDGAAAVFANRFSTCAVMLDGEVRCWGASRDGSLGVDAIEPCRARAVLASRDCAPTPQPLRWFQREEPAVEDVLEPRGSR